MTITAKVIQDSISNGKRITTYELEYPRFVHSELMTHRVFSRNSASSRAIPIKTMNELIMSDPAKPIHWGKNQAGMQAKEELDFSQKILAQHEWDHAMRDAVRHSETLAFIGAHKQISNRITEPFQRMKVVVTTTEDANWFWLRDHEDAQPEIREIAKQMLIAKSNSVPFELFENEWHVPYVNRDRVNGEIVYSVMSETTAGFTLCELSTEDARIVSASCCAQVSYRKTDDSIEKAKFIFDKLINSKPCHASPCEHQATPIWSTVEEGYDLREFINLPYERCTWQDGITHIDRNGRFWSANFQGWIQFRQLIPENAVYG